mgnify:FL=1
MKNLFRSLFIITSGLCYAQHFDAGITGGLSMSQVSGDQYAGYNQVGPKVGFYVSYPLNKKLNLQTELQYIQKGSKEVDAESYYSYKLNYLEMPITINSKIKESLSIETGIGTNYLISYEESEANSEPNKFALDFILGTTYQLLENTAINFRFTHSITPIRKHSSGESFQLNKGEYSNAITIALIYQINKK